MRRLQIDNYGEIVLSDTVGFIQDLPHTLVAAFHSTLEEVENSSILLHVIDRSNPEYRNHMTEVDQVLKEIGAEDIPLIKVFNKIDQVDQQAPAMKVDSEGNLSVFVSAQRNQGLDLLNKAIFELLTAKHALYCVQLGLQQDKLRAQIHARCQVIEEAFDDEGHANLKLHLSPRTLGWLEKRCVVEKTV